MLRHRQSRKKPKLVIEPIDVPRSLRRGVGEAQESLLYHHFLNGGTFESLKSSFGDKSEEMISILNQVRNNEKFRDFKIITTT